MKINSSRVCSVYPTVCKYYSPLTHFVHFSQFSSLVLYFSVIIINLHVAQSIFVVGNDNNNYFFASADIFLHAMTLLHYAPITFITLILMVDLLNLTFIYFQSRNFVSIFLYTFKSLQYLIIIIIIIIILNKLCVHVLICCAGH